MRILKSLLPQCLLALAMFAHGLVQASPTYRVTVDTAGYTGQGLIDFTFLANAGATPATAVLNNFMGAFGAAFDRSTGAVGTVPGEVVLGNQDGGNYLTQIVELGGRFSFNVRFDGAFAELPNQNETQFNATLYKDDFSDFIGPAGSFAAFELVPLMNGQPGRVIATTSGEFATVAAVPEPSTLVLSLTALAALGMLGGRRLSSGRHEPRMSGPDGHAGAR